MRGERSYRRNPKWQPWENELLRQTLPKDWRDRSGAGSDLMTLAAQLGRPIGGVYQRRKMIIGRQIAAGLWSPAEDERVMRDEDVPGRSPQAIRDRRRLLAVRGDGSGQNGVAG